METGTHGSVGEGRGVIPALDSNNGATFETERRAFKTELETCHALTNQAAAKPKNDRFHSLGVFCFATKAELVGEKQNKSWCCRVVNHEHPTTENWQEYFIGYTNLKDYAWSALEPGQKIDVLSPPALEGEAGQMMALMPGDEASYQMSDRTEAWSEARLVAQSIAKASYQEEGEEEVGF